MCTSSCPSQDHESWGDCVKAKNLKVAYCQSSSGRDYTRQKTWDRELDGYATARREGMQPRGTKRWHTDEAKRISDNNGSAFNAGAA